jgi:membrane-associated phospholipid phosphatase
MKKASHIFFLNPIFFEAALLFLAGGCAYLLFTSRATGFIYLNGYHSVLLDKFFIYYTNLGDGLFSILVVVLLLLIRRFKLAFQVLLAYIVSGLFAQLLKGIIYSPRPKDFFRFREHIHLIDGVTLNGDASFPSGHAVSAFALATSLALFTVNKQLSLFYLGAAILVGYSRIYLAQHFPADVLGGAIIGILMAILVYYLTERYKTRSGLLKRPGSTKTSR